MTAPTVEGFQMEPADLAVLDGALNGLIGVAAGLNQLGMDARNGNTMAPLALSGLLDGLACQTDHAIGLLRALQEQHGGQSHG